ncbi:leucine--tRNA ligase, partial [Candidatus Parcubacteria bacterium]|nr:leucine--tRNA ligase [Candidatus Parcubacteria bacterium]
MYQKKVPINWCSSCKTGLANEEVLPGGIHERCGKPVVKREMKQWLFKITKYADRLLNDLEGLEWPKSIVEMQRNWIGRSEGTEITFPTLRVDEKTLRVDGEIKVFTTRPDTIFGVTALVLAPEHPVVASLLSSKFKVQNSKLDEVRGYVEQSKRKSELERTELVKEKTGVFTGLYATNPINGERVPIWVGDYVIGWYGGGAVMVVPAHDQRDYEFAKKYDLPVKTVISSNHSDLPVLPSGAFEGEGRLVDSGEFGGLSSETARRSITEWLEEKGFGRKTVSYKLRDWVFSRQRYWGEPIPLVHCEKCGVVPVPEEELPLELPYVEQYEPTGTGESPLVAIKEWVEVACPKCGGRAKRETDTMPNWAGSCWYFLRFADPHNSEAPFSPDKINPALPDIPARPDGGWLPVDWYLGGAEHAVLHLLYARFWVKAMFDLGLVKFKEPFLRLRGVGMVQGEDGRKMSKSYGNVIGPDEVVGAFG